MPTDARTAKVHRRQLNIGVIRRIVRSQEHPGRDAMLIETAGRRGGRFRAGRSRRRTAARGSRRAATIARAAAANTSTRAGSTPTAATSRGSVRGTLDRAEPVLRTTRSATTTACWSAAQSAASTRIGAAAAAAAGGPAGQGGGWGGGWRGAIASIATPTSAAPSEPSTARSRTCAAAASTTPSARCSCAANGRPARTPISAASANLHRRRAQPDATRPERPDLSLAPCAAAVAGARPADG